MLLPVLEKKGVTNFNGDKANWQIRHIWGQFKGLCEEEPHGCSQHSCTQPNPVTRCDHHSPACMGQNKLCWHWVAQAAAASRWLCPPREGKVASPLPGLEVAVPSSSVQACPRGFGCLFPRCLALAGSSGLLQQLKNQKKMEGRHPVYREGKNQM